MLVSRRPLLQLGLILGLLALFAFTIGFSPASASSHTITECGTTINSSGTYVVDGDITGPSPCISVEADDVVIDGQGHTITFDESSGGSNSAVTNTSARQNVTVKNVVLQGWSPAIELPSATGVTVENVTFAQSGSAVTAMDVSSADGVTVTNSTFENGRGLGTSATNLTVRGSFVNGTVNSKHGILLDGTANARVVDTEVQNADSNGIRSSGSTDSVLENVTIGDSATHGLYVSSGTSNLTIADATVNRSTGYGVYFSGPDGVTMRDSEVRDGYDHGFYGSTTNTGVVRTLVENNSNAGVFLSNGNENLTLRGNAIRNNSGVGADVTGGSNGVRILNNTVTDNGGTGLLLDNFADLLVEDNTVAYNPGDGAELSTSGTYTTWRDNVFRSNEGDGLVVGDHHPHLVGNRFVNNTRGFEFADDNATLRDNVFRDHSDAGVYITGAKLASSVNGTLLRNNGVGIHAGADNALEATNVDVGDSTRANTTLDFTGLYVNVTRVSNPAGPPTGNDSIGRYVGVSSTAAGASFDFDLRYEDDDLGTAYEPSTAIFRDGGDGNWTKVDNTTVDTDANLVSANVSSFGDLGAFAESATTISGCSAISSPGSYALDGDVLSTQDQCIYADASDFVLHGQGHSVTYNGSNPSETAVQTHSAIDGSIRNLSVSGWNKSVYLYNTSGTELRGLNLTDGTNWGIDIGESPNTTVVDTRVANTSGTIAYLSHDATYENVTVRDSTYGFDVDSSDRVAVRNSTAVGNAEEGVRLWEAADVQLNQTYVSGNGAAALRVESGSSVAATGVDLGDSTAANTTLAFTAEDVTLDAESNPPAAPDGKTGIGRYFNATDLAAGGYLDADLHYEEADVDGLDESTLELSHYNSSEAAWSTLSDSTVDTSANTLSANATSFSTFGALAESTTTLTGCQDISSSGTYVLNQSILDSGSGGQCIYVGASDVTIDGNGYALRSDGSNNHGIQIATGYQNHTIRNVTLEDWKAGVYVGDGKNVRVENVTAVGGSSYGIRLDSGSARLVNVRAPDNDLAALQQENKAYANATGFDVGHSTAANTTLDFEARGIQLNTSTSPPEPPSNQTGIGRYFDATNVASSDYYLDVSLHYEQSDLGSVGESSLELSHYDSGSSSWSALSDSTVDTSANTLSANATSFSTFGALGENTTTFEVTNFSAPAVTVDGETISVNATVENTGTADGTETVEYRFDGTTEASQNVSLNASESTVVEFTHTVSATEGAYAHGIYSENDSDGATIDVAGPLVWSTDGHWSAGAQNRTVSDAVGDREADTVRLGYGANESGLVSYWPLDEDSGSTIQDAAGGNDGTAGGGYTLGQRGLLNSTSFRSDGSGQINVSDDPSLRLQGDMAVSFWVKTSTLGTSDRDDNQTYLLQKSNFESDGYSFLDNGNYTDEVIFRVNGENESGVGTHYDVAVNRSELNDGQWHNLVGVRDGTTMRLYLDGEERANRTNSSLGTNTTKFSIGGGREGSGNLDGEMEEVRVYNRSLTGSEVRALNRTTVDGEHVTEWRRSTESLRADRLLLENVSATLAGTDATVTVESDTDGDGTVEETSDPIPLADGTDDYDVSGISTDADRFRLRANFSTSDATRTPIVSRAELAEDRSNVTVSITGTNSPVSEGETLNVTANLTNAGGVNATQDVNLTVAGAERDVQTVSLNASESTTVTLSWSTTDGDEGAHTATVASENDSDSARIDVAGPLVWSTDDDWSVGATPDRTVSDDVGDRENDTVRLGYAASESGLVSYWPLDEDSGTTAVDATGGNDGEHRNGVGVGATGKLNTTAYNLTGTDTYVRVPHDDSLEFSEENAVAVSTWVQPQNLTGTDRTPLVQKSDTSYNLQLKYDEPAFTIHNGSDWTSATANQTLANDTWYHLVGTYDGSNVRLYVNGSLVATESVSTLNDSGTVDMGIGENVDDKRHRRYDGSIEELRLYGRNLTERDAETLYATTQDGAHTTDWQVATEQLNADALFLENVSATLGGETATLYVESDADGDGVAEETSDPVALADGTGDYNVSGIATDADRFRLRANLSTTDDGTTPIVSQAELTEARSNVTVSITGTNAPVVEGETLNVTANLTNAGDLDATQDVNLTVAGAERDAQSVSLNASESTTVTLEWATASGDAGEYTAAVASENDTDTAAVTVQEPANFSVAITAAEETLAEGEPLNVTANVTNVGDVGGTQTVNLTINRSVGEVDATTLSLNAGESANATLNWSTAGENATTYDATVASENDSDAHAFEVLPADAFLVEITGTNEPVTEGETLTVDANVSYEGASSASQDVTLDVGGLRDSRNVSFDGAGTQSIALEWTTESGDAGSYTALVASENDSDQTAVAVEEASGGGGFGSPSDDNETAFDVAIDRTTSPVHVGETLTVAVTVSNAGDATGTDEIELRARSEVRDVATVTLGANESRALSLNWTPTADDVGDRPVRVTSSSDSAIRYVTVEPAPTLDVAIRGTNAPIPAGRVLAVTADVTASGSVNQTVELLSPDGDRVDAQRVALDANESETLELTWPTRASDAGSRVVTVRAENDSASTEVFLQAPAELAVEIVESAGTVAVNETHVVTARISNRGDQPTIGRAKLLVGGAERASQRVSLEGGERVTVRLEWSPGPADVGTHELRVAAGSGSDGRSLTVQDASEGALDRVVPEWGDRAVSYEPTQQDTHVGGFLWLTVLVGGLGTYLFLTRRSLDARLLALTLLTAAARTGTDVLHATAGGIETEQLLALNTVLELYAGLLFLAFGAAYAEYARLLSRRGVATLVAVGLAGTVAAASNPVHGLVFGEVVLADGPFAYVTAETGPLGWVLLGATLASLLLSVGLLARTFLAGTDPAWRPVGVLAAGLSLAVVVVVLSVLDRGPIPEYDYTGAAVAGLLLTTTGTLFGHGLHRIKQTAQKSLIEDLDDPIVIANDARVVVEYNDAAAALLPGIAVGEALDSLLGFGVDWPGTGETTTVERSHRELVPERPRPPGDGAPDEQPVATNGGRPLAEHETGEGDATADERRGDVGDERGGADGRDGGTRRDAGESRDGAVDRDGAEPAGSDGEDPNDRHFLVQTTPVTAATGDSIGYTVRFTDVTELKRRRIELASRNAQLEQVASTISHDLRNPMTVAVGYVEQLRVSTPDPDAAEPISNPSALSGPLEAVRESLDRMSDIIDDILALARSDEPVSPESGVSFTSVVSDAWATVETDGVSLSVAATGTIDADPQRLQRMLENLFRNAVEHAGRDVTVTVGLTQDGFYVADDGEGIPAEAGEDVFEQGYTSAPTGTGLGLSIVSQLARAHGWTVGLDPDADGARFEFTGCETEVAYDKADDPFESKELQ